MLWSLCPASRESLARVGFLEGRWTAATQTAILLDTVQPAATDSSGRGHVGSGPRTRHTQRPGYRAHASKWASRQLVPRRNGNPAPHPQLGMKAQHSTNLGFTGTQPTFPTPTLCPPPPPTLATGCPGLMTDTQRGDNHSFPSCWGSKGGDVLCLVLRAQNPGPPLASSKVGQVSLPQEDTSPQPISRARGDGDRG